MDLTQRKLNKSEWESIEVPVSEKEKEILQIIINGTENVNIRYNNAISLLSYLKVDKSLEMEDYLFAKHYQEKIVLFKRDYKNNFLDINPLSSVKLKKADLIRVERCETGKIPMVYETLLLEIVEKILKYRLKNNKKWIYHYFTLQKLIKNSVSNFNRHILFLINGLLKDFEDDVDIVYLIQNAVEFIEKNDVLLKHSDIMLYEHQKEIFTIMKNPLFKQRLVKFCVEMERDVFDDEDDVDSTAVLSGEIPSFTPKLVLYIAPTGTGKTLTPLGISQQHRVIFMCAARHVGLALAKAAISVGKKIAFAFGCSSADDIRLHYFAAKEYKRNKKSGGIGKVDNSIGDKVEIIICDVRSYLCAMYYMLAFNPAENIVTYWDEPTITMDQNSHELHEYISKNWKENVIPNVILSSATLPKLHELPNTIANFKERFPGGEVHNIVSHDCKKSIPIINKNGYVVVPHFLSQDYQTITEIVSHCEKNPTLLRYFDLEEIVKFIIFVEKSNACHSSSSKINRNFASIDDVNMQNIKLYYLKLLGKINNGAWGCVYMSLASERKRKIPQNNYIDEKGNVFAIKKASSVGPGTQTQFMSSNAGKPITKIMSEQILPSPQIVFEKDNGNCAIYVSTKDAYTLTDGPTIFIAEDVEKIAKFCIQQANIPTKAMDAILEKIDFNNRINEKIDELEKTLECLEEKNATKVIECDGGGKYGGKNYAKKDESKRSGDFGTNENNKEVSKINSELDMLRSMIKPAELNETFVPNKTLHLKKWADIFDTHCSFTSDIDEQTVIEIMMLKNILDSWKILLLMGIGVFTNHPNVTYTEIMKKLADQQKLYMIISSSDYIYGTNYQFCHGYLSKDLTLTQEKMVQALGRIGRSNIQQTYSIRLRDDEQIRKLFYEELDKPEVRNMNALFG